MCEWWWEDNYRANEKTKLDNWRKLEKHVFPKIGDMAIATLTPQAVDLIFQPIKHLSGSTLEKINRFVAATMDFALNKGIIEYHKCDKVIHSYERKPSQKNPCVSLEELLQLIDTM